MYKIDYFILNLFLNDLRLYAILAQGWTNNNFNNMEFNLLGNK